ncbi:MAG: LacI family DNA-binding transcriptional regulator [Verrucomicrobiota bacterium]
MRVRLKDVAAKANVAVNTASTILNRRPNSWASKETAERVFQAAEELGYRPNRAALGLRIGRFNAIGLLIADLKNPFYTTFAHYLTLAAEKCGYDVVIESWRSDLAREKVCLEEILNRQLDGVVAFLSDPQTHSSFLERQFSAGMPFVTFGSVAGGAPIVDCVISDFESGLRDAVEGLITAGHRRFAFVSALAQGQTDGHRTQLFAELMLQRASSGVVYEIIRCGPAIEDVYEVALKHLKETSRPTAVIAINDLAAMAVMRAAGDAGIRVPDDVSVVGVDNIPLGTFLPISLSSISQPIGKMAQTAWDLIHARIESGKEVSAAKQIVYPTEFLKRESSGNVPSVGKPLK